MAQPSQTILLVDSDLDYLDWATKHLQADDLTILRCNHAEKALKVFEKSSVDLVIVDLKLQPIDGLEFITQAKARHPHISFILTAAFPSTSQVIEATQNGAQDVLRKESLPFELRKIVETCLQTVENRRTAEGSTQEAAPPLEGRVKMIGNSREIQEIFKLVGRVAQSNAPVLISGESGTGKELIANALHEYSPRRKNEMVAINCGAIPENLLESELFGHEKGSFTGAVARRAGRFEQCDEGTLFLDEIGDMPLSVQVKLLRILQEGSFSRVGSNELQKTDVRIVAATNKDLAQLVRDGEFREDLYYRLNVVELNLPPLRNRIEDVPLLAEFFLQRYCRKNGLARMSLSSEASLFLQSHHWPGNVRELENTIARACALAPNTVLLSEDIPLARSPYSQQKQVDKAFETLLEIAPEDDLNLLTWVQKELISKAIQEGQGELKTAARKLGLTVSELQNYLSTS